MCVFSLREYTGSEYVLWGIGDMVAERARQAQNGDDPSAVHVGAP